MKPPDLSRLSDADLAAEWGRRRQAKRQVRSGGRNGGRPPVPTACPRCGVLCPGAGLAKRHCKGK